MSLTCKQHCFGACSKEYLLFITGLMMFFSTSCAKSSISSFSSQAAENIIFLLPKDIAQPNNMDLRICSKTLCLFYIYCTTYTCNFCTKIFSQLYRKSSYTTGTSKIRTLSPFFINPLFLIAYIAVTPATGWIETSSKDMLSVFFTMALVETVTYSVKPP